jgi:hypothetical protein
MVDEVDGVKSAPRYLRSGVPHGCIRFAKFHFYANDLQIY